MAEKVYSMRVEGQSDTSPVSTICCTLSSLWWNPRWLPSFSQMRHLVRNHTGCVFVDCFAGQDLRILSTAKSTKSFTVYQAPYLHAEIHLQQSLFEWLTFDFCALSQDCAELTQGFFALREICETGPCPNCFFIVNLIFALFVTPVSSTSKCRELRQIPKWKGWESEDWAQVQLQKAVRHLSGRKQWLNSVLRCQANDKSTPRQRGANITGSVLCNRHDGHVQCLCYYRSRSIQVTCQSFWMQGVHRCGRLFPFGDEGMVQLNCKSDVRLVDELQRRQDFVERNEGKVNQITRGCYSVFVLYKESGIVEHCGTLASLTSVFLICPRGSSVISSSAGESAVFWWSRFSVSASKGWSRQQGRPSKWTKNSGFNGLILLIRLNAQVDLIAVIYKLAMCLSCTSDSCLTLWCM